MKTPLPQTESPLPEKTLSQAFLDHFSTPSPEMNMSQGPRKSILKIGTLNMISLITWKRKQWLLDLLNREMADIAFIQETKLSRPEMAKSFVRAFRHDFYGIHTNNEVFWGNGGARAETGGTSPLWTGTWATMGAARRRTASSVTS